MTVGQAASGPISRDSGFHDVERYFSIHMIDMGAIGIWQTALLRARCLTSESEYKERGSYNTERDEFK